MLSKVLSVVLLMCIVLYVLAIKTYMLWPKGKNSKLEGRGIWLTPSYILFSPEDVIEAVDRIADSGFNTIFLEVNMGDGQAEYHSNLLKVYEKYKDFDPAEITIKRAKERGIEVHAYIHALCNSSLIEQHLEVAMTRKNKDGKLLRLKDGTTKSITNVNSDRSTHYLSLYTPELRETTRTNAFGTEVVVEDNIVKRIIVGHGDADVPKNGYVLSGNGEAKAWLEQNIKVGDVLSIEDDPKSVIWDAEWIEPAHPYVIEYYEKMIEELLTKYDFDGIHLDNVRYPPTTLLVNKILNNSLDQYNPSYSTDVYGYSNINRDRFKREYGVDPIDISVKDEKMFKAWMKFRQDNITNLVTRLASKARSIKKDVIVSAALNSRCAYNNWDTVYSGVDYESLSYPLDVIVPMAYHTDSADVSVLFPEDELMWIDHVIKGALDKIGNRALLYVGIGGENHKRLTKEVWNRAIEITRDGGADGTVAFEYWVMGYLVKDKTNFDYLKQNVYKEEAKPTHSNKTIMGRVRAYKEKGSQ